MSTMCSFCVLNQSNTSGNEVIVNLSTSNGYHQDCNCKLSSNKFVDVVSCLDIFGPYSAHRVSLSTSLSSNHGHSSQSGDGAVNIDFPMSEDVGFYKNIHIQSPWTDLAESNCSAAIQEGCNTNSVARGDQKLCNGGNMDTFRYTIGNDQLARVADDSDEAENFTEQCHASLLLKMETDPHIWIPPEPEDMEDEIDSVANNDDDDKYTDGTKWGKPTSLSSLDEDHRSCKETHQKAMLEALNGQFRILVNQFLDAEGLCASDTGGENWVDIVASLSWEAASLIKPDASDGLLDPGSYVKVKCVAAGRRTQSQVINGLVFKKNTAHKHMTTTFKNPRLLLLRGDIGTSAVGLLSFSSMEQQRDLLKSIIEMIESCHPNVVLVEKTVSRDIQEALLSKGITLAFDMKLSRLVKIARCTGSQIFSCTTISMKHQLTQTESFHVEKVVEEHISVESSKRPCKTLMFIEGFSKPLGCTILLKGACYDELKKVKRLMHYTVFAAYQLIVETSFLVDRRTFFSDKQPIRENIPSSDKMPNLLSNKRYTSNLFNRNSFTSVHASVEELDIPASNGLPKNLSPERTTLETVVDMKRSSVLPAYSIDNASVMHDGDLSDHSRQSHAPGHLLSPISLDFTSKANEDHPDVNVSSRSLSLDSIILDRQENTNANHDRPEDGINVTDVAISCASELLVTANAEIKNKEKHSNPNDLEMVLDLQSILILISSRCTTKGVVCEQNHLSRIKYYGRFDLSLGQYVQDILLNKRHCCSSCGEPPEAHVYCYTHQNGRLIVSVKKLTSESCLPGEAEGKIWMWTRCLKCMDERGMPSSTQRIVMSSAARGLSFGKFLELSFSSNSSTSRLSRCGHSLHRDCLCFFGFGSKVAMFRYSALEIYAACKPPSVLNFYHPNEEKWLSLEAREVLASGKCFFLEVANRLQELKLICSSLLEDSAKSCGIFKGIHDAEDMLSQENNEFDALLKTAIQFDGRIGNPMDGIFELNWLRQELLLELYIWDRRLCSLVLCLKENDYPIPNTVQDLQGHKDVNSYKNKEGNEAGNDGNMIEVASELPIGELLSPRSAQNMDVEVEIESNEIACNKNNRNRGYVDSSLGKNLGKDHIMSISLEGHSSKEGNNTHWDSNCPASLTQAPPGFNENENAHEIGISDVITHDKVTSLLYEKRHGYNLCKESQGSKQVDMDRLIWTPFTETRRAYRNDHGRFFQNFDFVHLYKLSYLSPLQKFLSRDADSLHFPDDVVGNVISRCDDEISSVIACALARSEYRSTSLEKICNEVSGQSKGGSNSVMDKSDCLASDISMAPSCWSSTGSSGSDGMRSLHSSSSFSSDEASTSGSDSLVSVDHLITSDNVHTEIHVGIAKVAGQSKYSVVCIHAKEFYDLRRRCCPSELAYISSLKRCKKWDAQGGKSKAFFAKTVDDRFIIKQIKKAELDSFLKFASEYFYQVTASLDSGSQTCLAKILGVYQVRQNKGGKEVKTDLIVMENLFYGRNITRIYDLKGAVFSRYVPDVNDANKVFLDENFVEDMRVSPIFITGRSKLLLQRAIWNDTYFLTSINVMDYSLLVGVDKRRRELVFGIIDYLRQYTWDKQLETWVKSSLVVPKNELPTVISPKEYKKRFRKFMAKYFLSVPDNRISESCTDDHKICADTSSSSNLHFTRPPELLGQA